MRFVEKVYDGENVKLKGYLYEESTELDQKWKKRPTVVVCPGGGYWFCSYREADAVASQFLAKGFNAFVFTYSVGDAAVFPQPLVELSRAVADIRKNADEWGIDEEKIAVCGFSAGGHLTASLGTLWNDSEVQEKSACFNGENKPNALILGYPVISASWAIMDNSIARLIGNNDFDKTLKKLNMQNNVGPHTPPTFLVHTFNDGAVPVKDSLLFADALEKHDVPFDLHIFTNGGHGLSVGTDIVGTDEKSFAAWVDICTDWLHRLFGVSNSVQPANTDFSVRKHFVEYN